MITITAGILVKECSRPDTFDPETGAINQARELGGAGAATQSPDAAFRRRAAEMKPGLAMQEAAQRARVRGLAEAAKAAKPSWATRAFRSFIAKKSACNAYELGYALAVGSEG